MPAQKVVYDAEHEILHLGVAHIEKHLCAATPVLQGAFLDLQGPIRMFLEQFALAVHGFRLYPDAELDAVLVGLPDEPFDTVGQFLLVYHPITERRVVLHAAVLVAEPPVVHDEQFAAQRGNVLHHFGHGRFVDIEVHAFPTVEQHRAYLITVVQHTGVACPTVEVTAGTAQPLAGVSEGELRGGEYLFRSQFVFRAFAVDARKDTVYEIIVRHHADGVISAPTKGGADDASFVLARFPVEREHDLRVVQMAVARPVHILYHLDARCERFGRDMSFGSP